MLVGRRESLAVSPAGPGLTIRRRHSRPGRGRRASTGPVPRVGGPTSTLRRGGSPSPAPDPCETRVRPGPRWPARSSRDGRRGTRGSSPAKGGVPSPAPPRREEHVLQMTDRSAPGRIADRAGDDRNVDQVGATTREDRKLGAIPEVPRIPRTLQHDELARTAARELRPEHAHIGRQPGARPHQQDVAVPGGPVEGEYPTAFGPTYTRSLTRRWNRRGVSSPLVTRVK